MAKIEDLRKKSILDVAHALGMELKRVGNDRYVWKEHDSFAITPSKNFFKWFSHTDKYGDVFSLVQVVREEQTGQKISFKEAKRFLEEGTFSDVEISPIQAKSEPFHYFLEKDEHRNLELTRDYFKRQRGLSDRTINFFLRSGKIAEANYGRRGLSEPVIVFKYQDHQGQLVGAGLQGIIENREKHPERGRLKQIMKNSDGMAGFNIDIGKPERLVFAESPIDLMSYYELHQDSLKNVRLVAMDGLKEGLISRRFAELVSELQGKTYEVDAKKTPQFLAETARLTTFFQEEDNQGLITLAVDNDEAGHRFISKLQSENISFQIDIPPITQPGQDKEDWNDFLKKSIEPDDSLQHVYTYDPDKKVFNYEGFYSATVAAEKVAALAENYWVVPSEFQLSHNDLELIKAGNMELPNSSPSYPKSYYAEVPEPEEKLQIAFLSSNNAVIQEHYSPGDVIPFDDFTKVLYAENLRLLKENPPEIFSPAVSADPNDRTWFNIINSENKVLPLLDEVSFVIGKEQLSITNRLLGRLPFEYFEPAWDIDVKNFLSTDTWLKELERSREPEPEIDVKLFHGNRYLRTVSFTSLFNHSDIEEQAGGSGWFRLSPKKYFAEIGGERLNQKQVDNLIDRLIYEGIENKELIQMLEKPDFSLQEFTKFQKEKIYDEYRFQMERKRDTDGDGLANEFEQALGRDPYSPDNLKQGNPSPEEPAKEVPQKSVVDLIQAKDNKGLAKVLKEGVKDYFQSDTYKKFLETMSKFHNYSPRNIQLLLLQNPEVSHVASFKKWRKDFERTVNKGEKALRIFAPITVKRRDPKTKEVLKDKDGNDMTYTSYKLVPVFDVSQTSGKELAKPAYQIEGTHQEYANLYRAAKEVAQAKGVSIEISKEDMKANGYYSLLENKIVIKAGMSEQHTLKTIFHEMAHMDLHNLEKMKTERTSRTNAELQAESVAFVVASHYGFDTSSYSFAYLASWTDEPGTLADLEAQISIVQKEANELVQRLDSAFEKYQNKELAKDPLAAKLEWLNEKCQQEMMDKEVNENEKKSLDKENENDQPSK